MYHGAARTVVKASKHLLNSGDGENAIRLLRTKGLMLTKLAYDAREHELEGIVRHRLGVTESHLGNYGIADQEFQRAIDTLPADDILARAITERDWGHSYLMRGNLEAAYRHILYAVELLEGIDIPDERILLERIVTEGFLFRIDIYEPGLREQSIAHLLQIDKQLRGSNKLVYQLDNLRWIIDNSPAHIRIALLPRALWLNARMGNVSGIAHVGVTATTGRYGRLVTKKFRV